MNMKIFSLKNYLAKYEHVFTLLMSDPVDGLVSFRRLIHSLQIFLQDFLVQSNLKESFTDFLATQITRNVKTNISLSY